MKTREPERAKLLVFWLSMLLLLPALAGCYYDPTVDTDGDGIPDGSWVWLGWNSEAMPMKYGPMGQGSGETISVPQDAEVTLTFVESSGYFSQNAMCGSLNDSPSISLFFVDPAGNKRTIFTNQSHAGDIASLGVIPANTPLKLGIDVTSQAAGNHTYYMGPGSLNPDGKVHARILKQWDAITNDTPEHVWEVGFEGNYDLNDYLCWMDTYQWMWGLKVLMSRHWIWTYSGTAYHDMVVDVSIPICKEYDSSFSVGNGWSFTSQDLEAARAAGQYPEQFQDKPFDAMRRRIASLLRCPGG